MIITIVLNFLYYLRVSRFHIHLGLLLFLVSRSDASEPYRRLSDGCHRYPCIQQLVSIKEPPLSFLYFLHLGGQVYIQNLNLGLTDEVADYSTLSSSGYDDRGYFCLGIGQMRLLEHM